MKIYASIIVSCAGQHQIKGSLLCQSIDLPSRFFLHKNTARQTCRFFARTMAVRCQPGTRNYHDHQNLRIYVLKSSQQLTSVAITALDYPSRVAYAFCFQSLELIQQQVDWRNLPPNPLISFKPLNRLMKSFQDPARHDAVAKATQATSAAIEAINQTISTVLLRQENLEELAMASQDLSDRSKLFYKESKKRCCVVF